MKRGFTLIEVIIVIVILGVLATIALPRIAGQIEVANAAEAMQTLGVIKRSFVNCFDMAGGWASCVNAQALNLQEPVDSKFTYWVWAAGSGMGSIIVFEARRPVNGVDQILCMWIDYESGDAVVHFGVNPNNSIYDGIAKRTGANAGNNIWLGIACGSAVTPFF